MWARALEKGSARVLIYRVLLEHAFSRKGFVCVCVCVCVFVFLFVCFLPESVIAKQAASVKKHAPGIHASGNILPFCSCWAYICALLSFVVCSRAGKRSLAMLRR